MKIRVFIALAVLQGFPVAAGAAFVAETPVGAGIALPVLAAVSVEPSATLAPALSAAAAMPASAVPVAAGGPESSGFHSVVRRGRDKSGHEVMVIDAVDPAHPDRGTVGHVDVDWHDGQARLDQPLDSWVDDSVLSGEFPSGADFSHYREHLWFGLAVMPGYRGSGLGSRLLDEASARLRGEGVHRLFIRATESSVDFYRRHYGSRVRHEWTEIDGDEAYHHLEVDLTMR